MTIWSNRALAPDLAADLERRVAPHRVIWAEHRAATNLNAAPPDAALVAHCDIAFGQPTVEDVLAARKLKLVCLSSAGYTRYDRDDFRDGCRAKGLVVCNASGVYAEPCAQHLLAMMLSIGRQLPAAVDSQGTTKGWPYLTLRSGSTLLTEQSKIVIVGYGSIARRFVELLAPFRCSITAFRRKPTGDENCPTKPVADIDAYLGDADHIVNILPAAASTANFFDAARFARIKPGAKFYNIGRGDTVDQSALADALNSGQLGGAYLDVTNPEPLPPDHPLWTTPHCYITPHTGGGTLDEAERQIAHFIKNVRRFERGEAVIDRIF